MPLTNNKLVPPIFYGKGMEKSDHCGSSAGRVVLKVLRGIEFSETKFSKKLMKLYNQNKTSSKNDKRYDVEKNGVDTLHWINFAKYYNLGLFSSNHSDRKTVSKILDLGGVVVLHRPWKRGGSYKNDDGHYVVPYGHFKKEKCILVFDPGRRYLKGKKIRVHNGIHLLESYKEFNKNWKFKDFPKNKEMFVFYKKPKKFQLECKGRYLV
ncbi:MAG: C39 family peptidase [Nanoarchaeota archaeon]|nr:C39 family peptidase [Nanoarchaeota archaeon]